jgi:uncharacterized membrane protein
LEFIRLLIGTVALRPYVFVFFAIYLFLAVTSIGIKRTALFTLLAYVVAFVCEYSSSHLPYGIPFGVYRYIETTRGKELWIAGVPFMDSLSFTFLSFISYRVAILILNPSRRQLGGRGARSESGIVRGRWPATVLLAGFLMMYLDIIIDPVSLQGKRWFLGQLYFYPQGGPYFGITIANFLGWFVVCVLIIVIFSAIERRLVPASRDRGVWRYPFQEVAPAGLYFGVIGFNLWVTFTIGETSMGWAGVFITLPLLLLVVLSLARNRIV